VASVVGVTAAASLAAGGVAAWGMSVGGVATTVGFSTSAIAGSLRFSASLLLLLLLLLGERDGMGF